MRTTLPGEGHGGDVVDVVQMEDRPVDDGLGKVQRPSAVGEDVRVHAEQPALIVVPRGELRIKGMALARDHHVQVPVQLNAHGLARFHGSQGNEGRERVTLHLLAAEPAPHAGRLDDNAVARRAQDLGDDGLDLRRMLRGGADEERALLPGLRPGRVRLQVEMLLAARAELTFQAVRGFREGFLAVAALQRMRLRQEALPAR